MATKQRATLDVTDVLQGGERRFIAENAGAAYQLDPQSPNYQHLAGVLGTLAKDASNYKGKVNVPERLARYLTERDDFTNVKEMLTVLALRSGDPALAKYAMEAIQEAYRGLHVGYSGGPVQVPKPAVPKKPKPTGGENATEKELVRERQRVLE